MKNYFDLSKDLTRRQWCLIWRGFAADDDEGGGTLGDAVFSKEPVDNDDHIVWQAQNAARPFADYESSITGFMFDSRDKAIKARAAANKVVDAHTKAKHESRR
jgi:hypothetical protein